jgi:hypothetical protein
MNRLAPLIVRRTGPLAPEAEFTPSLVEPSPAIHLLDDLKLFAFAWAAGLVFFGTFFS